MLKRSTILNKQSVDTIAIGSFDGLHMGHRQLIKRLGDNGALFVIDKDQANLTPGIKRSLYAGYPCMFYHFLKVKHLSGADFVALLQKEFPNLKKILVGYDFCFGNQRSCTAEDLKVLFSGEVEVVEAFIYQGIAVHSSVIRAYLVDGKIEEANRFLGREYSMTGTIVQGQGLGKKELVPTLNLSIKEYLIPKEGVYATRTKIGHHFYHSVSFIGKRVSTDNAFSIETHILGEILDVSVEQIELFFVHYIRENRHFESLFLLKEQIENDILEAKRFLDSCHLYRMDFL